MTTIADEKKLTRRWANVGVPLAGGTLKLRVLADRDQGIVDQVHRFEGPDAPPADAKPQPARCGPNEVERWGQRWMTTGEPYPSRWRLKLGRLTVLRASWFFDVAWWAWQHGGSRCWRAAARATVWALLLARPVGAILGRLVRWAWRVQPLRVEVDEGPGCGCHVRAKQLTTIVVQGARMWLLEGREARTRRMG